MSTPSSSLPSSLSTGVSASVPVPPLGSLNLSKGAGPAPRVAILDQDHLVARYGDAPSSAAFQALSDRLVTLARQQPVDTTTHSAFVAMGDALGAALTSNPLSIGELLHLTHRMVAARAGLEPITAEARKSLMKGYAQHIEYQDRHHAHTLEMIDVVTDWIPAAHMPRRRSLR